MIGKPAVPENITMPTAQLREVTDPYLAVG